MRCLITGTRFGRADVWHWMRRYVRRYGVPSDGFVLGDNVGAWQEHKVNGAWIKVWRIGVDHLARVLCEREGWPHEVFEAHWDRLGRRAGFERDERMVRHCSAGDHALAFPSPTEYSKGTWTTAGLANDAGLKVFIVPHVRVLRPMERPAMGRAA